MADLVLDWAALGPYGATLDDTAPDAVTTSVDTGGVAVDITFSAQDAGASAFTFDVDGYVGDTETFDPNSHLKLFGEGGEGGALSPTSTTALDFRSTADSFTDNVQNVAFRLNDVDRSDSEADFNDPSGPDSNFLDNVTILAFDAEGNSVPVTLTPAGTTAVDGAGQATGTTVSDFDQPDGSVLVNIAGPVSRVEIVYENGGNAAQGVLVSDVEFATVDVMDDNEPPTAVDDMVDVDMNETVTFDAAENDTDPDGDDLSVTGIGTATNGTATLNGDGTVSYTPNTDFIGEDTVSYTVDDGNGGTDDGEIVFTVANTDGDLPPMAIDDDVSTDVDTSITLNPAENDIEPEGEPLLVSEIGVASNGTAVLNDNGTVTYTPNPGFIGEDSFTYEVVDTDGLADFGTVTVTVEEANESPTAVDDTPTTPFDTAITLDPTENDTDPDGDDLTVSEIGDPTNGTATLNDDGTVTYDPNPGFVGEDTIPYTVDDGNGGTDTGEIIVTVDPEPNTPPTAVVDTPTTEEGTPITLDPADNDTDPDGDDLTVSEIGDPTNGTATLNDDGTVTYDPDPDFVGEDTIPYTVDDGNGGTDTGEIIVTVEAAPNTPPTAVDDTPTTEEGTPITFDPADNDTDPDGDDLTVTEIGDPTNGTATLNDDGTVTYDPDPDFVGQDTISYTVDDGNGGTDTGEIVVTVEPEGGRIDTDVFPVAPEDQDDDPLNGLDEDDDPSNDLDNETGTDGADTIATGDDDDTIAGGAGDDVILPGIDDDLVDGGGGDDTITDVQGADTITGGQGNDVINAGIDTFSDYVGDDPSFAPGTPLNDLGFTSDPNQEDGRDSIEGNLGNDVIFTGDDRDTIDGGGGNDTINAGIDDDLVMGGQGDDSIIGSHGSDTLDGGQGNDYIDGSNIAALEIVDALDAVPENDRDLIDGALGDDTLIGGDDDDTLRGGSGDDSLDGGIDEDELFGGNDDDTLIGGQGNDTLDGGAGDDSIDGGADRDTIIVGSPTEGANDTVQGGSEGDDFDTLDLRPVGVRGEDWRIVDAVTDSDGNGIDGTVEFLNGSGDVTGTMDFFNIETVVPCFTPGTLIATPSGEKLVEDLREGDRIITRDNGIQEIRWVGRKDLTGHDLARKPHMKPILVQKGSLGNGLPEHDMLLSPNHRVLVNNDKTALYFEEREVLAAAKHLTGLEGVDEVRTLGVSYLHFMFDSHEVVLSNGAWTESFQPGDYSLNGIGNAQRQEILELFPELEHADGINAYASARRSLKKHEAQLLTK